MNVLASIVQTTVVVAQKTNHVAKIVFVATTTTKEMKHFPWASNPFEN